MAVRLRKTAIDLGIVAKDGVAMLSFFTDLLGFRHKGDIPFSAGDIMHRLWCGDSLIKIVVLQPIPDKCAERRGIAGALEIGIGL